ncbi:MAG: Crp/Fnr family transcriptional regulator [Gammaproteobacteria bacterium]|nr:Crp/Fnr family transcriptional regulator [Gammaproteobacteria bacterium]
MDTISEHIVTPFADIGTNDFFSIDEGEDAWSDAHANFLSSLSESETQTLLKCTHRLDLKSRDHLFRAGDRSNDVYIVAGGCIRLFQVSPTGKETILWFSFPGEIFGMAELWRGSDRQLYAVANEATQVYSIRSKDFINFLGAHPEAAMKAIGILSARVRALGHILVGLTSDNVETRIARLLMRFAAVSSGTRCSASSTEDELCVNVRLTHQDIANLIGASRQTVSSTLAHLRKIGAVRTVNQHIHIVQPDHMRRLLGLSAA